MNQLNNLLPVGLLLDQSVERCTGIPEVKGFKSCISLNFFQAFFLQLQKFCL